MCPICDASYKNYNSFKTHLRRHKNREEFNVCQKNQTEVPYLEENLDINIETPPTILINDTNDAIKEVDSTSKQGTEYQGKFCFSVHYFTFFLQ